MVTPEALVEDEASCGKPWLIPPKLEMGGVRAQDRGHRGRDGWRYNDLEVPVQGNPVFQRHHIVEG